MIKLNAIILIWQIYFAGVNCWEPGSECRVRFKNVVERYPQLVAYIGLERAVEYRGPLKADHMIKFLHSIIHPLIRLNSVNDLERVRHLYDVSTFFVLPLQLYFSVVFHNNSCIFILITEL